jgi:hypothetical protein
MLSWIRFPCARPLTTILALQMSALVVGCLSDKAKSVEPPATCSKAGDSCTFSPGKLGLCIESTGGNGSGSLVCQSQH